MDFNQFASLLSPVLDLPGARLAAEWAQSNSTMLYILAAFAVGFFAGRRRPARRATFQTSGEARASRILADHFRSPDYHLMNHITLPLKKGTTQIDHILVSIYGVFVIETKDYRGWIFGSEAQRSWTQVLFRHKFRFQNPLRQNLHHVEAVRRLLDFLPPDAVKSVVLFTGTAEFKTAVPPGVFSLPQFVAYLRGQTNRVMSAALRRPTGDDSHGNHR